MTDTRDIFKIFLKNRKDKHLYRQCKTVNKCLDGQINTQNLSFIDLASNDYLGLSIHKAIREKASQWALQYGAGSGASRLVTGNSDLLEKVEAQVKAFKNVESCLIMPSGFQANATVLAALFNPQVHKNTPLIFSDKLNHASIHFGCSAAQVKQIRYRHNDMNHLEALLKKHKDSITSRFIISETVFSMDGDIAPVETLRNLANAHKAVLILDDAHAFGVLGPQGTGLAQNADITVGTFSKAAGCMGAYVTCPLDIRNYLMNAASGIIYSTAVSPPMLGAMSAALELIPQLTNERNKLQTLAQNLRVKLQSAGLETGQSASQIIPVMAGTPDKAFAMAERLREKGYWVTAIRPPTVPEGTARLRIACSTRLDETDIDNIADILSGRFVDDTR